MRQHNAVVRARGFVTGGYLTGSGWFVESTAQVAIPPAIVVNDGGFSVRQIGISFEAKELKNARAVGTNTTADAVGTFTLKGVAKELTVPVHFTHLKDRLSARTPNQQGDLLVLRAKFNIKRRDFNIQPGQSEDKVADTIGLTLAVAGASPK